MLQELNNKLVSGGQ